jgi:hypothetical protein
MTTRLSSYGFPIGDVPGLVGGAMGTWHGGTARLTLQQRLWGNYSTIVDVKEWGAVGDGVHDDYSAIQNAINYAQTTFGSAIIWFPKGTYNLGTNQQLRLSPAYAQLGGAGGNVICLLGAGRDVTVLKGSYSLGTTGPAGDKQAPPNDIYLAGNDPKFLLVSWRLDLDNMTYEAGGYPCFRIEGLTVWNESLVAGTGALDYQVGEFHCQMVACRFIGVISVYYANSAYGGLIEGCVAQHPSTITPASFPNAIFPTADQYVPFAGGSGATLSKGFWLAQGGDCVNNVAIGHDIGFALDGDLGTGSLTLVTSNRAYRCKVGFGIGYGGNGMDADSTYLGNRAERCEYGISAGRGDCALIAGNAVTGTTGPCDPAAIAGMSSNGTTVTVQTAVAHNIPAGGHAVQLSADLSGWFPTGNATGIVSATVVDSTHFRFPSTHSGAAPTGSSTWTYPSRVALNFNGYDSLVAGNYLGGDPANPLIVSHSNLDLSGGFYRNLALVATHAPVWIPPVDDITTSWKMIGCSGSGIVLDQKTMATLPLPQAGTYYFPERSPSAFVDATYTVTDAPTSNFGDTVAGALITSAPTASGNQLHFTSVPAGVVAGMTVFDAPGAPNYVAAGWANNSVASVGSNYVNLQNPVGSSGVPPGRSVGFKPATGGSNHYKVRYDGWRWVRVG